MENSHKLAESGIYVRAEISLIDSIKKRSVEGDIDERRWDDEKSLILKGFINVKVLNKTAS